MNSEKPNTSKLICIEGIDFTGKTTQAKRLVEVLNSVYFKSSIFTREPGGTIMAEEIREVVLKPREEPVDPNTELLLFFAARNQHIKHHIQPELEANVSVICDRFVESSYAYQVIGKGASHHLFNVLTHTVVDNTIIPDLTLVIDIDEETRLERIGNRVGEYNRLDEEDNGFHQRAKEFMREMAKTQSNYQLIDGNGTEDEVHQRILDVVLPLFQLTVDNHVCTSSQ